MSRPSLFKRLGSALFPSRLGNWQNQGITYADLYHKDGTPRQWGYHGFGIGQLARMADHNPVIQKARRLLTTGVSSAIVEHLEVRKMDGSMADGPRARKAKQILCWRPRFDHWLTSRDFLCEIVSDMMYAGYAFVNPIRGRGGLVALERLTLTEGWIRDYTGAVGGYGREIMREDSELTFRNQSGDEVTKKFGEVIYLPFNPSSSPWGFELPISPLASLAGAMALTTAATRTHILALDSNQNIWNSHVITGGRDAAGTGRAGKSRTERLADAESGAAKGRKPGSPYRMPQDTKLEKTLITPSESEVKEARNYSIQATSDTYGMPAVLLGGSIDSRVASGFVEARRSFYMGTLSPVVGTITNGLQPHMLPSDERFHISGIGTQRFEFMIESVMKALGTQQSPAIITRETAARSLGIPTDELDAAREEHFAFLDRVKSAGQSEPDQPASGDARLARWPVGV